MRRSFLLVSTILGLGLAATAAAAQMDSQMMPMGSMSPNNTARYGGDFNLSPPLPSRQERYGRKLLGLRDKLVRMTKADGGQLTEEHKAGLQRELDALNRQFGFKTAGG